VGAAIEAGLQAGRPSQISVVRFADQLTRPQPDELSAVTAIVAVTPGLGLAELFSSEGACVVPLQLATAIVTDQLADGLSADVVSQVIEALLAKVLETGAARVVLLPNLAVIADAVEVAAERARTMGVAVSVVPTKSPVQGLAAVAVHDPDRRFEDDVIAMAEAAAATRFAEVTVAAHDSITYAGRCRAGDILGLIDGEVVEIGSQVTEVGIGLVRRLIDVGGELVTVLSGSAADGVQAAEAVTRFIRTEHPLVEVNTFDGGQAEFPLLIGVE
jgi:dihydroxyacetone kinase-like predicted kinase